MLLSLEKLKKDQKKVEFLLLTMSSHTILRARQAPAPPPWQARREGWQGGEIAPGPRTLRGLRL